MNYLDARRLEVLSEAAADTFENLAFAELRPCDLGLRSPDGLPEDRIRIDLGDGATLGLAMDRGFLEEVAAVIHNLDVSPTGPVREDSLREIINIIAGRFQAGLAGGNGDFNLGLPEPLPDAGAAWSNAAIQCGFEKGDDPGQCVFLWIY